MVATLTSPPYTFNLTNVTAGSYTFTAKATDNNGAITTSAAANVTVTGVTAAAVYYIYTDQLNTPRAITNEAATPVWKWDNTDPFGANAANEDPDGDTNKFVFNLRFPGQYFDRETNTHYNYMRDYDPSIGRYVESDPIGLQGGINTYAYTNNPLSEIDPRGLMGSRGRIDPTQPDYSSCSYYDDVARKNGCKYHAFAAGVCRGNSPIVNFIVGVCGVSNSQLNCIRNCLVKSDQTARNNPSCKTGQCGGCTKKSCIDAYHNSCFESCGVGKFCYGGNAPWSYFGSYPNDGD